MRTDQLFLVLSTLATLVIASPVRRDGTNPIDIIPIGTNTTVTSALPPTGQETITSTVWTEVWVSSLAPTSSAVAPPGPPPPPPPPPSPTPPPTSTKSGKAPKASKNSKDSKVTKDRYSSSKAMQYARALAKGRNVPEEGDIVPEVKRAVTEEAGVHRVDGAIEERDDTIMTDTAVAEPAKGVISGPPPKDLPLVPGAAVITVDAFPAAPTRKTQKNKSGSAASIWNSSKVGRFKRGEEGDNADTVREETGVIADEDDLRGVGVDVVQRGEGAKAGFIGVEG